jgi:hypothetical protein
MPTYSYQSVDVFGYNPDDKNMSILRIFTKSGETQRALEHMQSHYAVWGELDELSDKRFAKRPLFLDSVTVDSEAEVSDDDEQPVTNPKKAKLSPSARFIVDTSSSSSSSSSRSSGNTCSHYESHIMLL